MIAKVLHTCFSCGSNFSVECERMDTEHETYWEPLADDPTCPECGDADVAEDKPVGRGFREDFHSDI